MIDNEFEKLLFIRNWLQASEKRKFGYTGIDSAENLRNVNRNEIYSDNLFVFQQPDIRCSEWKYVYGRVM